MNLVFEFTLAVPELTLFFRISEENGSRDLKTLILKAKRAYFFEILHKIFARPSTSRM